MLYRWKKNKNVKCKYVVPATWKEPCSKNDCYFCVNAIKGFNTKNKHKITYITVPSVTQPILANLIQSTQMDTSAYQDPEKMEVDEDSAEECNFESDENDISEEEYIPHNEKSKVPALVSQLELNDLVRDLGLPKDGAEYLASIFKERNFLRQHTKVSFYRDRDRDFRKYFAKDEVSSLVYCTDVKGLINGLKENCYKSEDWRLFIDSSKRSIKAVLFHNTNMYAPVPIAHSTVLEGKYESMEVLLEKIDYMDHHQWQVYGDLKIITLLLGQQSGFTKNPCYLCLWDSRDRQNHYKKIEWPVRTSFDPGSRNIIHESLVDPTKILIPPLHIKLGLMKQFVKALDKTGQCFQYLRKKFPKISDAKIKEGVFDGPQIRTMFKDTIFSSTMNEVERTAWLSFQAVAENFLGNRKTPRYKEIVSEMLKSFQKLGCLMNLKLHFLHSHLDKFPENLGHFSEEQGERFHQDIKVMETRYQGRWDENMMADFCWMLKRDTQRKGKKRKKNPLHRSFEEKRTRYSSKKENV